MLLKMLNIVIKRTLVDNKQEMLHILTIAVRQIIQAQFKANVKYS